MKRASVFLLFALLLGSIVLNETIANTSGAASAIYNSSGTEITGEHFVIGTVTLAAGTATVTFSGRAVYTSSASFFCTVTDRSGLNLVQVVNNSGSSITINGVLTDSINFVCLGT